MTHLKFHVKCVSFIGLDKIEIEDRTALNVIFWVPACNGHQHGKFIHLVLFFLYKYVITYLCLKRCQYLFLAPLTWRSAQRSWWYYWFVRRPSVNFCFKSLLLLQFLFDNSEFFTGETRHIVPPCNKAGISNFCLEFQKLQKFQISWKRYSSYSSYSKILNFLLEKLGI